VSTWKALFHDSDVLFDNGSTILSKVVVQKMVSAELLLIASQEVAVLLEGLLSKSDVLHKVVLMLVLVEEL